MINEHIMKKFKSNKINTLKLLAIIKKYVIKIKITFFTSIWIHRDFEVKYLLKSFIQVFLMINEKKIDTYQIYNYQYKLPLSKSSKSFNLINEGLRFF